MIRLLIHLEVLAQIKNPSPILRPEPLVDSQAAIEWVAGLLAHFGEASSLAGFLKSSFPAEGRNGASLTKKGEAD
jgi:hypothetical protein